MKGTIKNQQKRVRFPACATELLSVHIVDRIEESEIEALFWQPWDERRSRQEVKQEKKQQRDAVRVATKERADLNRLTALVAQARHEIRITEEKTTTAPIVHFGFMVGRTTRRNPLTTTEKGRALMA